ncbi:MAG: HEAT repeat domain-containing protein [Pirellulales bacterium]|nr:HEAT repeat domain-containing protein [Pirellulales bacterium]
MLKNLVIPSVIWIIGLYFSTPSLLASTPRIELNDGDRIVVLGGTLAERMQHDGWLETMLQSHFPEKQLSVRNLGFSADSVSERLRVAGFGSQKDWLKQTKPDVIFAFWGFNESFAGEKGLPQFEKDLRNFIVEQKQTAYNGETPPKLILFSPIAHENLRRPQLPTGELTNNNLRKYTEVMSRVARETETPFVDLFTPTLKKFKRKKIAYTINGIHLNEWGNHEVANIIVESLFPERPSPSLSEEQLQALQSAIQEKNFYWFHRYQTTDGYNVHGHRADLKYIDDLSNREVMLREMEILEAMAANRDHRIWSLAQGNEYHVTDDNLPEQIEVVTNAPGKGPNGKYIFTGGEEAIEKMTVAEGAKVNLFASEEQFPELINPVQIGFDTQNRLFVAAWPSYPHWKPGEEMNDKLLILDDTDQDGKADTCKTFADGLHNPTGFEFWGGGVFVAMAPDLLFLKDTDGDDKADVRIRVLHGLSSGDTHHAANSFVFGPDGCIYFGEGIFHRTQIETPHGPIRNRDGCIWRFDPRTWKVERFIPYDFANPHGHVFDRWGQNFVHDGTSAYPYHAAIISGHIDYPAKRRNKPPSPLVYQRKTRPCPATEILSTDHFPEEYQDDLLVGNVIGFQGILRFRLDDKESSFAGVEKPYLVESSDPNFRPTDIEVGPEGAVYFSDWQNPIIGHMQHHIRDPSRDNKHGRVYRITYPERPFLKAAKIHNQPIEALLELLKSPENRVRYRARIELSDRDSEDVLAAVDQWIDSLASNSADDQHHLLEALWVQQQHHGVNKNILTKLLESPDYRVRAAAVRVLSSCGDEMSNPYEMLARAITDPHPRVRLEAVRACSFFQDPQSLEIALRALEQPMDRYLEYALTETVRQLQQIQQKTP